MQSLTPRFAVAARKAGPGALARPAQPKFDQPSFRKLVFRYLWIANQSFEGRVQGTRPSAGLADTGERETSDCKERVTSEGDL
ncbi:hypothetical protein [Haladaptatus litoreus]|uniref:hypothetical protein n=1 Tax=Haladaptatus litoreus TaxID=553468 RepID=UPI00111570D6|nr:hypothetical protein [Haladaptatus litoreus]